MPSPVWNHFQKSGRDAICVTCGKLITSSNTTNMWYHLQRQHEKIYADLQRSFSRTENTGNQKVSDGNSSTSEPNEIDATENAGPTNSNAENQKNSNSTADPRNSTDTVPASSSGSNSSTTKTSSSKPLVQTVLQNRFLKTTKAQAERITIAIAYLIAVACLAYSFVENVGFRHLMSVVVPNYQVPSRKVFSDDRIPKLYLATKTKISNELKNIENLSVTTDGWTSSNSHKFIAITVSYINESWQLICRTLACRVA